MNLIYVMDPMCSWCYAFQPQLEAFLTAQPQAKVSWIMGGLAPDTSEPMPQQQRQAIAGYWRVIEQKTSVTFNHDFWSKNIPFRSTYPACRAVIAAEQLRSNSSLAMVKAIQKAYYQEAQNPSLADTLVECAVSIGLDSTEFTEVLNSPLTQQSFEQHLSLSQQLQVQGFPALFYIDGQQRAYPLTYGYCEASALDAALPS
ncbi:DsbA family protein [Paraferrimonas haliotis]|uniref:DsbA family protein n=1 Tax=Paraferrimonas haliotis TaxID=2013866 RepID=A0AA37WYL5_9GAMM|nr:DsbA family protein [Paraferrimonas haliotis]GLS84559.1 DsbA family protein [Paraferrimonas haliotis]